MKRSEFLQTCAAGVCGCGLMALLTPAPTRSEEKKDQAAAKTGKGSAGSKVEIEPLLPADGGAKPVTPYLLRLDAGAAGTRPFFDHKGPEFGWILSGVLRIVVEQEEILLRKGDSVYLEDRTLNRWRNEGTGRVELIWVLC